MQAKIASIYFDKVTATRIYGLNVEIPAVAQGAAPEILILNDRTQYAQEPSPDGKSRIVQRYLVTGDEQADDLIREWTRESVGMTAYCHPGIWKVRENVPLVNPDGTPVLSLPEKKAMFRPATAEEREQMWQEDLAANRIAQDNWGQYLIDTADAWAVSQDPVRRAALMKTPLMKVAARYYGKERDWLSDLQADARTKCPVCTESIPAEALRCPKCHEIVDNGRYLIWKRHQNKIEEDMKKKPWQLDEATAEAIRSGKPVLRANEPAPAA